MHFLEGDLHEYNLCDTKSNYNDLNKLEDRSWQTYNMRLKDFSSIYTAERIAILLSFMELSYYSISSSGSRCWELYFIIVSGW